MPSWAKQTYDALPEATRQEALVPGSWGRRMAHLAKEGKLVSGTAGVITTIETIVNSTNGANFQFNNIPQTYTSLHLVGTVKKAGAHQTSPIGIRCNGDATANYHSGLHYADGTVAVNTHIIDTTNAQIARVPGTDVGNLADRYGSFTVDIPNYTRTDVAKTFLSRFQHSRTNAVADMQSGSFSSLWRSTAAITSLTVVSDAEDGFVTGSKVTLYGVSA